MRTTLELDDEVVRRAKMAATARGTTLTRLMEEALRLYLSPPAGRTPGYKLRLLTKKGRLLPGVDLEDRDSLYDRMESRS